MRFIYFIGVRMSFRHVNTMKRPKHTCDKMHAVPREDDQQPVGVALPSPGLWPYV